MKEIRALYREWRGQDAVRVERLTGSGSNRQYFRLWDAEGNTTIGVEGTDKAENDAFIYLARHFRKQGLPVPEVLDVSADGMCYMVEDLGSLSLFDALSKGRACGGKYDETEESLLYETMRLLPLFQVKGAQGLDWSRCYGQQEMDRRSVMFDLNYFKYCFLKPAGQNFDEVRLEDDFQHLADDLTGKRREERLPRISRISRKREENSPLECRDAACRVEKGESSDETLGFLYRDFQARNVMLRDGKPFFIDFQGGRRGPFYYDVASFLWQASARYPSALRQSLISVYYDELKKLTMVPTRDEFDTRLSLFVLFRTLQVLGAYGFRGWFERKQHFLTSIPAALHNLRQLLQGQAVSEYPYLKEVLETLSSDQPAAPHNRGEKREERGETTTNFTNFPKEERGEAALVVRVFSFSYKKGIPEDQSGNGGGYVFDCRSTHNPGRYEQYKSMTGLDAPVIKFLEDDGEILTFLNHVYELADKHVERYMERGFTDLMFSFGCTGGQHRSVYSAQHLAEHLFDKYGIEVRLCHREQGINRIFKKGVAQE